MSQYPDLDSAILLVSCVIEMSASDYRNLKKTLATATDPIDISIAKSEMEQIERFFRESPLVSELGVDGNNIIDRLINEDVKSNIYQFRLRSNANYNGGNDHHKNYYDKNKAKKKAQEMSRYKRLKEQGICVRCGSRPAEKGRVNCQICKERKNQLRKRKS